MKRGAIELSFGMIFSIILIIAFVGFAFFAIGKFLGMKDSVLIGQFMNDFQIDVDKMWADSQGSQIYSYSLPSKIKKVCLKDDEYENLYFEADEFVEGKMLKHLDMEKILGSEENICFDNNGKVSIRIEKDFGENLVTISSAK